MKKLISCCVFLYSINFCFSQNPGIADSLQRILQQAKTDTDKVWAMHNLAFNYMYNKPDSSMLYAQKALALSKKAGYVKGEIRSMNDIGNTLNNSGNTAKSIEIFLDALQKAEALKDQKMQAATFGNLAEAYKSQGDYREAINYTFRSLAIDLASHDTLYLLYNYLNLGDYYEKNNQADSALIYQNQAYQLNLKLKNTELMGGILFSLGNIQARLGNDDVAMPLFRKATAVNEQVDNLTILSQNFFSIAKLYQRAGKQDSAFYYLKKSYAEGKKASYQEGMLNAATMLATLYEKNNNDSTLKFLKLSVSIKDSIFSQEKVKQIQSLTFAEQFRQTQELDKQHEAEEEHRQNIESAAIGIGIITFIIFFLLYSRSIIASPRLISTLGLIALLVTFEFFYLLIDRFLEGFTHESTLWMLLIWVALGVLLAPVDKFMERWIQHRLVEKNKAIKIAAAHKTLDELEAKKK